MISTTQTLIIGVSLTVLVGLRAAIIGFLARRMEEHWSQIIRDKPC